MVYRLRAQLATDDFMLRKPHRQLPLAPLNYEHWAPGLSTPHGKYRYLSRAANFMGEMLKFFPSSWRKIYAGKMFAPNVQDADPIITPRAIIPVTGEFRESLDEYGIQDGDAALDATGTRAPNGDLADDVHYFFSYVDAYSSVENVRGAFDAYRSSHGGEDIEADGKFSELESLWVDGYLRNTTNPYAFRRNHVADYHHSASPDNLGFTWGDDILAGFKNFDAEPSIWEFNHINRKNGGGRDPIGREDEEQAYSGIVQAYLSARNWTFGQLTGSVKEAFGMVGGGYRELTYHQVVMERLWEGKSDEDVTNLVMLQTESEYRADAVMTEIFGSVTDTRNDAAMIENINNWIGQYSWNAANPHLLTFFLWGFKAQLSYRNRVSMYHMDGVDWTGIEWNNNDHREVQILLAAKDRFQYRDWSKNLGRSIYGPWLGSGARPLGGDPRDAGGMFRLDDDGGAPPVGGHGILFEFRNQFDPRESVVRAALGDDASDEQVAAERARRQPIWDSLNEGIEWYFDQTGPFERYPKNEFVKDLNPFTDSAIRSLNWDRKAYTLDPIPVGDEFIDVSAENRGWIHEWDAQFGHESWVSPSATVGVHPDYIRSQVSGLNILWLQGLTGGGSHGSAWNASPTSAMYPNRYKGSEYYVNWGVHAVGALVRNGESRMMELSSIRDSYMRQGRVEFKDNMQAYEENKLRIADEKRMDQESEDRAQRRRAELRKSMLEQEEKRIAERKQMEQALMKRAQDAARAERKQVANSARKEKARKGRKEKA